MSSGTGDNRLEGRINAIQGLRNNEAERIAYTIEHMPFNKAYRYALQNNGADPGQLLEDFRTRFRNYRNGWRGNPTFAIQHKLYGEAFNRSGMPPLCVDIEVAAVCDLACPFCYRQWIATPDKMMREDLYYKVIDQCEEVQVPSVKLNWRGEPLLHPKLPQFVDYAKRAGVLETIINTDAVTLTEEKSRALIEAGLDVVIYSFDGGTRETYEDMRVGRFEKNSFDKVYENIRRFHRLRNEMGSKFPRTKIQMILTEKTFGEQEAFFKLFADCVDDVSVKAYTERGAKLSEMDRETRASIDVAIQKHGIPESANWWQDLHGSVFVSTARLACEQPYQRLMVTYDGRVCMCCYDWGVEHPVGYVDAEGFESGDHEYEVVLDRAKKGARGYELLSNIVMPKRYVTPARQVQTLKQIWQGQLINDVRHKHVEGRIEDVEVCRCCPFKETYRWVKLDS